LILVWQANKYQQKRFMLLSSEQRDRKESQHKSKQQADPHTPDKYTDPQTQRNGDDTSDVFSPVLGLSLFVRIHPVHGA
jgi:hypothetical protein